MCTGILVIRVGLCNSLSTLVSSRIKRYNGESLGMVPDGSTVLSVTFQIERNGLASASDIRGLAFSFCLICEMSSFVPWPY